ncbi:MAG: M1 family aminopeptidase [Bacteroidia bacterium]
MKNIILIIFTIVSLNLKAEEQIHSCQQSKQLMQGLRSSSSGNERSDTIDILNYQINLEIIDFTNKRIKGNCRIAFKSKQNNINTISLDLLRMTIDSIKNGNQLLSYTYNDTLLIVQLPNTLNINDNDTITVFYNGQPQTDASGWGGFYFQSGYAFNLGVGFAANPHNFGRVWFPCFDNFVERSTYEFNIITAGGRKAYCNGYLVSENVIASDTIVRTWNMDDEIPTYLACVSVANYAEVNLSHNGINGPISIVLAALANDTTPMKNSFINLGNAIDAFENRYGEHKWNKIGYHLVPFSSGAMEHATAIAYPRLAANGNLTYETLMAHEFAHHWWGDLATCETAEDMWLNEGWATYSEHIFLEWIYGKQRYIDEVKANYDPVIQYAHIKEGGYRAVSGVPHQYTYGDHVYKKGAMVAHALRGYMGDSLFFKACKDYMNTYQFRHVNSVDMMNTFNASSGLILNDFFNDWVFNPGFTAITIDSVVTTSNSGNFNVTVYVKQTVKGAPANFTNVPVSITFMDNNWNQIHDTIIVSGNGGIFNFTLPFNPVYTTLNLDNRIPLAISDNYKTIKTTGSHNFNLGRMNLTVNSISDSAFIRVEHIWVGPGALTTPIGNLTISPDRYWKIDGILPSNFSATTRLYYDGRTNTTSNGNGYLDHNLLGNSEDSIVLLYRRNPTENWRIYPYYTQNMLGTNTPKYGYMQLDSLLLGEYVFAYGDNFTNVIKTENSNQTIKIYPNPASNDLIIEFDGISLNREIKIYDMKGKNIAKIKNESTQVHISTQHWNNGVYIIAIENENKEKTTKRVVINK